MNTWNVVSCKGPSSPLLSLPQSIRVFVCAFHLSAYPRHDRCSVPCPRPEHVLDELENHGCDAHEQAAWSCFACLGIASPPTSISLEFSLLLLSMHDETQVFFNGFILSGYLPPKTVKTKINTIHSIRMASAKTLTQIRPLQEWITKMTIKQTSLAACMNWE